jgi:two-component system cell cycle sensor histidine kinase/response regulator CckA
MTVVTLPVAILLLGEVVDESNWPLLGLGSLAAVGLFAVFGLIGGIVHIGGMPRQRAFFQGLSDAIEDAFAVTDTHGRVVFANSAYRDLLAKAGVKRLVGVENLYAGHPEVSDRIYRLAQTMRRRQAGEEEFRLAPGSAAAGAMADRPMWYRISVMPIAASLGESLTLWRLADISQDRLKQESAFSRLQYIIGYLDHAPAGFFSSESDGRIVYINATLAGWLGLALEETADSGLTLDDIASPDGRQLILGVAPGDDRTETFDLDLRAKNGRKVPVRIIHRADFGEDGRARPSRSLVLLRRPGELGGAASHVAELQLSRLFNNAPIGIAEVDGSGRLANANPAFLRLSPDARRGSPLGDIAAEGSRRALTETLGMAQRGNEVHTVDITLSGDGGRSAQLFVLRSGESNDAQTTVYAVDTTVHRALEAQLGQSQKMQAIGQLAGGVAHDFNNVLTAIIGFSDLLLARHRPTDPAFADLMNIKQNANRAANLVRQLLAFSRRQTLRPEVLSLTDALSDLGNLLGRLLGEKIDLKVSHGRDVGLVKIDVNQFEQVIVNLAVNARDAMPQGGTLTVRTANVSTAESKHILSGLMPPGEYVVCEVEDNGIGMPPEVVDKIYEPFFSTKDVGKGTGLGLSTVYGIVKQTGGFITCESTVGKGTRFCIYLPRHYQVQENQSADAKTVERDAHKIDLTGKGTILLVEDEDAVRAFASRALVSRGYHVLEANSGERALELYAANSESIDLVLSDVVMPEMDGPTLLKELRRRGATTKMVFISGYVDDAFERNLEGEADFAFLPKPFTLKQLAAAVKQAMDS